ncbi:MAG TPA: isoprenylcysteine carboxylmethyltransferase family protein [Vicinamibacterales bacterium]
MADVAGWLVRRRVALGAALVVLALAFARPTWFWWSIGLVVACVGAGLRVWAAGHLEKNREVTTSGPYRFMRHPLYAGTTILAVGAIIAVHNSYVGLVAALYMATAFPAAIQAEETHLRSVFGDLYDRYARDEAPRVERRFSLERAVRNKEYRAASGVALGFGILALRLLIPL